MKAVFVVGLCFLVGCNAPSPFFAGQPATRVDVAGSVFDVRVRRDMAEAVRINTQYAPRFGPIRVRAAVAMAEASGCKVSRVLGDQAVATGQLTCDGPTHRGSGHGSASEGSPNVLVGFSCLELSTWLAAGKGQNWTEFECDPV